MNKVNGEKDIRVEDEVRVEFVMRVNHIAGKEDKDGQIFGFTNDGLCVSAPVRSIVERFPREENNKEFMDIGRVF